MRRRVGLGALGGHTRTSARMGFALQIPETSLAFSLEKRFGRGTYPASGCQIQGVLLLQILMHANLWKYTVDLNF